MTKIVQLLRDPEVTPELVNEFFHFHKAIEPTVDAQLFKDWAELYGLNWAGLYAMAIIETGWFTSSIFKLKKNLFGLGAVDSDPANSAAIFFNYEEAVEAGAQHLGVYAGAKLLLRKPTEEFVLERTAKLRDWGYFGLVTEFRDLGGKTTDGKVKWASNPEHGHQIEILYSQIVSYCLKVHIPKEPEPVEPPPKVEPVKPPTDSKGWKSVLAFVLRIAWPILTKFFPWFGWLTVAVYAIIEFLSK